MTTTLEGRSSDGSGGALVRGAAVGGLIALLVALADVALLLWTSYVVAPAALGFAALADLALLLPVGLFAGLLAARRGAGKAAVAAASTVLAAVVVIRWRTGAAGLASLAWILVLGMVLAVPLLLGRGAGGNEGSRPRGSGWQVGVSLVLVTVVFAAASFLVPASGTVAGHLLTAGRFALLLGLQIAALAALKRWSVGRGASWADVPVTGALGVAVAVSVGVLLLAATWPTTEGLDVAAAPVVDAAAEPSPAVAGVLLVVLDTVRADHTSLHGYERRTTPRLEELARRAHVADLGYANAPWSLPAHASLLTGLRPHQHGAHTVVTGLGGDPRSGMQVELGQRRLAATFDTLPELLARHGFRTAAVAANYIWFNPEYGLTQGFQHLDARAENVWALEPLVAPFLRRGHLAGPLRAYERTRTPYADAGVVVDRSRRWLEDHLAGHGDRPFLLTINLMDAHWPYTAADRVAGIPELAGLVAGWPAAPGADRARTAVEESAAAGTGGDGIDAYDRSIAYADHYLGRLLDFLEERGVLDATMVVVTADHGETFYDDGHSNHGANLLDANIHVPMLVKLPGQRQRVDLPGPLQQIDVLPTVLMALGLPVPEGLPGTHLGRGTSHVVAENYLSAIYGEYRSVSLSADEVDSSYPSRWALVRHPWKLVRRSDGRRFLYRIDGGGEGDDVAARWPELVAELDGTLDEILPPGAFTDFRTVADSVDLDPALRQQLRALGYLR